MHRLLPEDTEVGGLLALMLLTDARRPARTGPDGELILLAEQDRGRWDRRLVAEGDALISAMLTKGEVGPYQLQTAIAAVHDLTPSTEDTDWPRILALYGLLERMSANPMVGLNRRPLPAGRRARASSRWQATSTKAAQLAAEA